MAIIPQVHGTSALDAERSVGSRALEITEIVENVLQHFSARQLFGLQRVSPKFKDVISGNKTIRKKLWLDPSAPITPVTGSVQRHRPKGIPKTRPTISRTTQQNDGRGGAHSLLQDMLFQDPLPSHSETESDRFKAFFHSDEFCKATWPLQFEIEAAVMKVEIDTAEIFKFSGRFDEWSRPLLELSSPTRSTTKPSWRCIILPVHVCRLELFVTSGSDLMIGRDHNRYSMVKGRGGKIMTLGDAFEQVYSTAEWWYEKFPEVWRVLSITLEGEHWFRKNLLERRVSENKEYASTIK